MSNKLKIFKSPLDLLVEELSDEERMQIIIEGSEFQQTGMTGSTLLRSKASEFQKKLEGGVTPVNALYLDLLVNACHKYNSIKMIEASQSLDHEDAPNP